MAELANVDAVVNEQPSNLTRLAPGIVLEAFIKARRAEPFNEVGRCDTCNRKEQTESRLHKPCDASSSSTRCRGKIMPVNCPVTVSRRLQNLTSRGGSIASRMGSTVTGLLVLDLIPMSLLKDALTLEGFVSGASEGMARNAIERQKFGEKPTEVVTSHVMLIQLLHRERADINMLKMLDQAFSRIVRGLEDQPCKTFLVLAIGSRDSLSTHDKCIEEIGLREIGREDGFGTPKRLFGTVIRST